MLENHAFTVALINAEFWELRSSGAIRGIPAVYFASLSGISFTLGRMIFNATATMVDTTTGDFPKIVVTHAGKAAREADA